MDIPSPATDRSGPARATNCPRRTRGRARQTRMTSGQYCRRSKLPAVGGAAATRTSLLGRRPDTARPAAVLAVSERERAYAQRRTIFRNEPPRGHRDQRCPWQTRAIGSTGQDMRHRRQACRTRIP